MKNNEVVIIGGGLAGLTAAIHLSKIGRKVIVIEKSTYPRHKVCGEYVSNEVLPYLNWLDVNPDVLKPAKISRLLFSTRHGKTIDSKLALGGFGVSRYKLDDFLYKKVLSNNATVLKASVISVGFSEDVFTIHLSDNQVLKSRIVIGAFGKRSNIDQKLQREFLLERSPWLAVKGHFNVDFPHDLVGLYNFKGGYCGVSKVENNTVNICYLANYSTFKQYKSIKDYQEAILYKNPLLKAILEKADPIFERPITISQISFTSKKCVDDHILMIGDSAGLIHPLCGNGMAMAIHSAKIVSELVEKYYSSKGISRASLEKEYSKAWHDNFANRLKTGRMLSKILHQPRLTEAMMRLIGFFPSILPRIISRTHGKPIKI